MVVLPLSNKILLWSDKATDLTTQQTGRVETSSLMDLTGHSGGLLAASILGTQDHPASIAKSLRSQSLVPVQSDEFKLSASDILLDEDLLPQLSGHISSACSLQQGVGRPSRQAQEAALVHALGLIMLQLLTGRYWLRTQQCASASCCSAFAACHISHP